jgi:hypothetical protein
VTFKASQPEHLGLKNKNKKRKQYARPCNANEAIRYQQQYKAHFRSVCRPNIAVLEGWSKLFRLTRLWVYVTAVVEKCSARVTGFRLYPVVELVYDASSWGRLF